MKTLFLVTLAVLAGAQFSQASTIQCENTKRAVKGEFHFNGNDLTDITLTVKGDVFLAEQLEIGDAETGANQSFYIQVVTGNGNSYIFHAEFGQTIQIQGVLDIFSSAPMSSSIVDCTISEN